MPNLNRFQLPPPSSWSEFEDLCLDLWSRLWSDNNAQKNGRKGQAQHGVDVFGNDSQKTIPVGVQCKGKDNYTHAQVTQKELNAEIVKAESFKPTIKHFILATTAPQDKAIQEYARKISEKRKSHDKFTVSVVSWEWILSKLGDYPDLINKYYGEFAAIFTTAQTDTLTATNNSVLESGAFSPTANASGGSTVNQNLTIIQQGSPTNPTEDITAELAFAKESLDQHKAVEALHFLDEIHDRVIAKENNELTFKLFANKGVANLDIEKQDVAAKLFIKAAEYSSSRKALLNKALAYVIQERQTEALELIDNILKEDPENTKAYAYRVLATTKTTPYEELVADMPASLLENTDIAFALADAAEKAGNDAEALKWAKKAYTNDSDGAPEVKSYYAGKLIEPIASAVGFLGQLSDSDRENVEFAIKLFTEAWETYKDSDTKRYKTRYLYNRGMAKRLLGDMRGAIQDTEAALALSPSDIKYKFHLAQLVYENNEKEESIKLLEELLGSEEDTRVRVMLSERYMEDGQFSEALQMIEPLLSNRPNDYMQHSIYLMALSAYASLGNTDAAKKLIDSMRKNDSPLFTSLMEARLYRQIGDKEAAIPYLKRALKEIDSSSTTDELSLLADALYTVELYQEASEAYEKFIDPNIVSPLSKRLLNSYYRAGRHKDALVLSKLINDSGGSDEYTTEMESSIHEAVGNLASAQKVCERYLELHPDAHAVKIRLATVYYRQNKISEISSLIDTIPLDAELSMSEAKQLAAMYSTLGEKDKALRLMYEVRRKFYSTPDAHMGYLGLMLHEPASEDDPILHADIVAVDTVVTLKNRHGQEKNFIIEERPKGANIRDSEYDIDSEQAKLLLGKKVGDNVKLGHESDWKITGIKNKFLHALHETMNDYATLFPGSNSLMRFSFDKDKPEEFIEELKNKVGSRSDYMSQVLAIYKEGKSTIGATAKLSGSSIIDTMHALMEIHDIGVRASAGSIDELNEALNNIESKPKLVVDLTALVVIHMTGVAELLHKHFGKFIFAQSSIDELKEKQQELIGRSKNGYASLSKQGEKYINDEVTPERVKRSAGYIESLLDIITTYGEVQPATPALDINAKRWAELQDLLGDSSIETALLAKQDDYVLLSDDERLRGLVSNELGVKGVWTQALLYSLSTASLMDKDEYDAAVIQLVEANYKHSRIDASMLVKSVSKAKNKVDTPYTNIVNRLTDKEITEESLVMVASEFLYLLWQQPLSDKKRKSIAQYLIERIVAYAQPGKRTISLLMSVIEFRFKLHPDTAKKVLTIIKEVTNT